MKKAIFLGLLISLSSSIFAGSMQYYYQYENRQAVSLGSGYNYYNMELKDSAGDYQPYITVNGMTVNVKAEMPLKSMSGISLFLDTSLMIPSTSYLNSQTNPEALNDSTFLEDKVNNHSGTSNYILIDNNLGINMLGTITPSFFVYLGGGLDFVIGHSSYKYNDGTDNQSLLYGFLGVGVFQTLGVYFEFTDNIALNVGINLSYDFLIYNYEKNSADSSSDKFEQIEAKGSNYLGKVMLMYNF